MPIKINHLQWPQINNNNYLIGPVSNANIMFCLYDLRSTWLSSPVHKPNFWELTHILPNLFRCTIHNMRVISGDRINHNIVAGLLCNSPSASAMDELIAERKRRTRVIKITMQHSPHWRNTIPIVKWKYMMLLRYIVDTIRPGSIDTATGRLIYEDVCL